jgi:hypothetical protein
MFLEDVFDEGHLGQVDVKSFHQLEDGIDLGDYLLTTTDRVVVGLVEVAGRSVQELHEAVRGQLGDHVVGVLLGNVQLVVLHQR